MNAKVPHRKGFLIKGQCFYLTNGWAGCIFFPWNQQQKWKIKIQGHIRLDVWCRVVHISLQFRETLEEFLKTNFCCSFFTKPWAKSISRRGHLKRLDAFSNCFSLQLHNLQHQMKANKTAEIYFTMLHGASEQHWWTKEKESGDPYWNRKLALVMKTLGETCSFQHEKPCLLPIKTLPTGPPELPATGWKVGGTAQFVRADRLQDGNK